MFAQAHIHAVGDSIFEENPYHLLLKFTHHRYLRFNHGNRRHPFQEWLMHLRIQESTKTMICQKSDLVYLPLLLEVHLTVLAIIQVQNYTFDLSYQKRLLQH